MKPEEKVYQTPSVVVIECDIASSVLVDSNIDRGTIGEDDGDD